MRAIRMAIHLAATWATFAIPVDGAETMVLPRGSVWKYQASGDDLGTAWRAPGYADSGWGSGPAPLGYGETYVVTEIPSGPPNHVYRTSYFRATFTVPDDPAAIAGLRIEANYDDGFVAYLNGQEVLRRAMPGGTVGYNTFADNHEGGVYEVILLASEVEFLVPGENLIAVELHQSSGMSSDLVLDLELSYTLGHALVTRGPYLQSGTPQTMVVRWRTDRPTDSRVEFGTAIGSLLQSAGDPQPTTEHEVLLAGLEPATRYYYAIGSGVERFAGDHPDHSFRTPPAPGTPRPTRLWVIGDSGTANADAVAVREAYLAYAGPSPDLWLMLGDNAYFSGSDSSYQIAVFDMYAEVLRRSVVWPTRGNHDFITFGPGNDIYDLFTLPTAAEAGGLASGSEAYYSFDHANIHFICLDSEASDRSPGGAMLTWLAADLAATEQDWIVAFWHHPPYSKGSHDSDNPADSDGRLIEMRENALPILEAGGVDLVLTGHSHSYERSVLLDRHYGASSTLDDSMKIDPGDGRPAGDGAYQKPPGNEPHRGAVYAVAGSSGQISGGTLDHPVMVVSLNVLGSMVIDVDGSRLVARFLGSNGAVGDSFTIVKTSPVAANDLGPRSHRLSLEVSPNPIAERARIVHTLPAAGRARVSVVDLNGRRVRTLLSSFQPAGRHEAMWDGRDQRGRRLGPGVYFALLEWEREVRARKLVITR